MASAQGSQKRLISPPPPASASANTLPHQINSATQKAHTELNKLITARIPLALPPNTDSPVLYLHGIHTFAQLYLAFEDAWQDLICKHLAASQQFDGDGNVIDDTPVTGDSSQEDKLRSYLATLVPPALWRSQRAELDIKYLSKQHPDAQLPILDNDAVVNKMTTRVLDAVDEKPHILLAYAWVLYMAIFSGGRWIRAQLVEAGPAFWGHAATPDKPRKKSAGGVDATDEPGISLFFFPGDGDGEDLKASFKERLALADDLLTPPQKRDVVVEAGRIFDMCAELVRHLDARLGNPGGIAGADRAGVKELQAGNKSGKSTISAGEESGSLASILPEVVERDAPTEFPGIYVTKDLNPFIAGIVIALGIGVWYVLHKAQPWTSLVDAVDRRFFS